MEETQFLEINAEKRTIAVPSDLLLGVLGDKDVERVYFRCPKIVGDNINLAEHQIYVKYVTAPDNSGERYDKKEPGIYHCQDVIDEGEYITFSWKLSGNVFEKEGFIAFSVSADDGEVTRWNTFPAIGTVLITIPGGLEEVQERYPDIITQLLNRMDEVEAIATPEAMQRYVDTYLAEHPVELDETLTDNTKAAPADVVGELKEDLVDLEDSVITVEKTPNMVNDDTSTWVQGTPDGVFDFCVMTNAIDVSEYKTIMLGWNSPISYSIENVRLWHLDSNMIKIGNSYPAKETDITLDDDVKYVKIGLATGGTLLNPSMIDCKTLGLWLVYGSTPLSSWEPYEISHNNIEENRENISKNTISIDNLFDLIVNGGNLLSLDSFNTINEDRYESRKKYTFLNSFKKAFSFEKGILTTPHSTSGTKFAIFADTQFDEGNPTSTFWKTSGTVGDYTNAVNTFKYLDTLNLDFASILGDVINDGYQSDLQYVQLSIFDEIVKNIKNYPLMTYRGNHDPKVSRFSNKGLIACNGVKIWFAQADYVGDAHHSCGTMTLDYISWLENEISKHSDEINIVCGHYPINTDEFPMLDDFTDDTGTERHGHRAEFVAMLNRVGVKLYLSGHLHHTNWGTYTKDGITNIDCGAGFDSYAICNVSSSGLFTMDVYNTSDNTRRASISTISVQL